MLIHPPRENPTFIGLVINVRKHRHANGLSCDMDVLEQQIEEWLCDQLPSGFCVDDKGRPVQGRGLTMSQIEEAMKPVRKSPVVTQAIAEERAAICVKCEYNIPSGVCETCKGVVTRLKDRTTLLDSKLKLCAICKCFNKAQVHVVPETIVKRTPAKEALRYPKKCWKRRILEV